VLRAAFWALLLSTTVLQRFGVNLGSYSLNAALLGMCGFLLIALGARVLLVSLSRLLLYGVALTVAAASLAVNMSLGAADRASLPSLALLAVMYVPYWFVLKPGALGPNDRAWALESFSTLALFMAICGILQFYAQFLIRADWLFDFTPHVPELVRGPSGFNTVIPVGSAYKSNGFFMREPSGFSFLMALACIVEVATRRRVRRVACFGFALLLTYSGTGILALAIGMLFPLGKKTLVRALGLLCGAGVVLLLLGSVLNLSFTLGRIEEFGAERSSAYIRYVAPLRLVAETFDASAWSAWLGHGPGAISRETRGYEFHDPTWAKLLFEYGALGFVAFLGLFLVALTRREVPAPIRAALFFAWLMMGGHLLSPEQNFLTLALVGLLGAPARVSAERPAPRLLVVA
jgi:hypothetical protein